MSGKNGSITIAVASGKGGTGKTTVSTALARAAHKEGRKVTMLDCDVEEPNSHIFLKPRMEDKWQVSITVPEVNKEKCTACGECGKICAFSAIIVLGESAMTFPELCHSCGGCWKVCPEDALGEIKREIGMLRTGKGLGGIPFIYGSVRIGEAMGVPLIRQVKEYIDRDGGLTIIDAPPGTSCPAIESVRGSDFVLLVTEPTPFGLNDLKLAVEMVRVLGIESGVVINRCDVGDNKVREYCAAEGVPVLLEIPDDRRVAEAYSRGELPFEALPDLEKKLSDLLGDILEITSKSKETAANK